MPTGKPSGKPARQLLFSEDISQQHTMTSPETSTGQRQDTLMEPILQEITKVGRWLEGMDTKIPDLAAESRSIRIAIAGFEGRVTGIEHLLVTVEGRLRATRTETRNGCTSRTSLQIWRTEAVETMYAYSHSQNVQRAQTPGPFSGTLFLPSLASSSPPLLEFQWPHRMGTSRKDTLRRAHPMIACFLWHKQVRQLLTAAHNHSPHVFEWDEIHITDDFSCETNLRRKAFLALRPQLQKLDIILGLFEPAHIWITKDVWSRDFDLNALWA
ncbi:hypothetical protein NDU88_004815 [Pleurodeles waltl]|uniref:Uncharacterized protein n=1 Tax=Pleurodeles waltl TaxID=8319 RepID=A0AAV7NM36_PLEWA|nr:hypothetical protein NDU88_004815 [Pleurodeles waltl]